MGRVGTADFYIILQKYSRCILQENKRNYDVFTLIRKLKANNPKSDYYGHATHFWRSRLFAVNPYEANNPKATTTATEIRSRLFFINSSEANNPKSEYYGHATHFRRSGNLACSSSTLLRPTTPKMTTTA